ncbi:MAG: toll/interleukin-1 receptor domain-containing protein [Chitinophagaceae bacterium]
MMLQKIFFSYSRIDGSDFALKLALDLKKEGLNVWIDQQDIRAGSEWDIEVEKALETCDCLLFVETEKSVSSNNVLDEVYYALGQHKKVIPLIVQDSKTPFRLQRLQHIDFTKDYNSGLVLLINELKGNTTAEVLQREDGKLLSKVDKPFYTKYARHILIITSLVIIIAAAIFYTTKNKQAIHGSNDKIVSPIDTITANRTLVDIEPEATSKIDNLRIGKTDDKVKILTRNKKVNEPINKEVNKTDNKEVSKTDNKTVNLNETFAGDWKLIDVDPKAESTRGYLKIEALDEKKVKIKSYFQFYYFKTNNTSFLTIFNGFAGCSSCLLEEEMRITAEDIAIGSQTYKILKEDQPDGGKAGDTIMNAGSNKSIRSSVTLHLINNKIAVIKVKNPVATELSHGLVLQPFVYSFRFTKTDY